jgi:hypothetical protein
MSYCYVSNDEKERKSVADRKSSDKFNGWLSLCVPRYAKIRIKYNLLISGKLRYPATLWCRRCRVSHLLLYVVTAVASSWDFHCRKQRK